MYVFSKKNVYNFHFHEKNGQFGALRARPTMARILMQSVLYKPGQKPQHSQLIKGGDMILPPPRHIGVRYLMKLHLVNLNFSQDYLSFQSVRDNKFSKTKKSLKNTS